MTVAAHDLIDQVLQRVRDPQGTTASREFVLKLLSSAQQLLNAKTGYVTDEATLVTEPLRCFYPIQALLPQSQKVMYVRDASDRDLLPVTWRSFWYMKRGWPREVAERLQLWSTVGRDVLVLWPTLRASETVTVVSAKLTTPLVNEHESPELPDNLLPMLVDLTEVLTLLKMRKQAIAGEAMSSLLGRIAANEPS